GRSVEEIAPPVPRCPSIFLAAPNHRGTFQRADQPLRWRSPRGFSRASSLGPQRALSPSSADVLWELRCERPCVICRGGSGHLDCAETGSLPMDDSRFDLIKSYFDAP